MAGYHPEIDDAIDRVLRAAETVGPSLFERSVVRLLAMLAKHRPDAAPRALLTEEEARRWSERLADRLSDLPEGQFGLAVPIIKEALSNLSRGDIPPDVRSAPASSPLGEWQCASCHARETEAHREWCQVEDKAGTIARHAPPHTHPLSPEDAARGFVPAWTDDKDHLPNVVDFANPLRKGDRIGSESLLVLEVRRLACKLTLAGAPRPLFVAVHEKNRHGSMLTMFVCLEGGQREWSA